MVEDGKGNIIVSDEGHLTAVVGASDTPTSPSRPTTAISADTPFSITYSSETMASVGK